MDADRSEATPVHPDSDAPSAALMLTVCLVAPADESYVRGACSLFEGLAAQILVGLPAGSPVQLPPAEWPMVTAVALPDADDEATRLNALTAVASQPWVLVLPPGHWPDWSALAWLKQHLQTFAAQAGQGLCMPDDGRMSERRWCLIRRGLRWQGVSEVWVQGEAGEPVDGPVLAEMLFRRAPAPRLELDDGPVDLVADERRLRNVLRLHPQSVRAHHELSELLLLCGRVTEAYGLLQAAWRDPVVRDRWVQGELPATLASLAYRCHDLDGALAFARAAIAEVPCHPGAWEVVVRTGLRRQGAAAILADAEAWWRACLTPEPVAMRYIAEQPAIIDEALRHLVWAHVATGQTAAANRFSLLPAAPPDLRIHVLLATGRIDEAIARYGAMRGLGRQAQQGWQAEASRWRHLPEMVAGMIWSSLPGDHYRASALAAFDRAVQAHPNEVELYWRRAIILSRRWESMPAARKDLYRALQLAPGRSDLWRKLGQLCQQLGDTSGAQAAWREVTRLAERPSGRA
jgi:tetratricopeptide (TPR) repeat protein